MFLTARVMNRLSRVGFVDWRFELLLCAGLAAAGAIYSIIRLMRKT
jgi:hypothetical protein